MLIVQDISIFHRCQSRRADQRAKRSLIVPPELGRVIVPRPAHQRTDGARWRSCGATTGNLTSMVVVAI
jgi:hypothetical protein